MKKEGCCKPMSFRILEASDSFDLISNYPELIYQCGVTSASFDNGCLTDVPDHIKKHCERWGWVMIKKIE
jgi:hypothetical protein